MTEQEYIDATNLAAIRIAKNIITETLPNNTINNEELKSILVTLYKIEERLVKKIGELDK